MAMSAAGLKERVKNVVTCPICLEDYTNPRSLPCLHTFCFKCVEDFMGSDPLQTESSSCPVCRQQFSLGDKGVAGLPINFFIADLLDARKVAKDSFGDTLCEVCSSESGASSDAQATAYCVHCSQSLCERCSLPHKRWKGGGHQVLSLEEVRCGRKVTSLRSSYCEKDPEEIVKMYCRDCKANICVVCFATEHRQHQCEKIEIVAEEMGRQIDTDVDQVSQRASAIQSKLHQLELSNSKFIEHIHEIEMSVQQKAAEMKQLIDSQMQEVLDELKTIKQKVTKYILRLRDSLDLTQVSMESFVTYSKELRNNGKPCDMCQAADCLHNRAMELQNMQVPDIENCIPNVSFIPAHILETSRIYGTMSSFIGEIVMRKYSSAPHLEHILPTAEPVWGIASLDDQLYVLRNQLADQVEVCDIPNYALQGHLPVPKLRGRADMASSSKYHCLYLVDCVARNVHQVQVKTGTSTTWPVHDEPWGISVSSSNDIVISCDEACKFKIFSPTGNLLREILLYPDVMNPCHVVETVDKNFVLCHGAETDTVRGVCLIAADGRPGKSYSENVEGKMINPSHLAVDRDGFVFVADATGTVLMLSPQLGYMCEVASPGTGLHWKPWRLCIAGQRLYVAYNEFADGKWTAGRVNVFEL